jgi:hypothetical protein
MSKETFLEKKEELIFLINELIDRNEGGESDRSSLFKLLEIFGQYSFENRLEKKGLLTHTIIDSLQLDYSLGEKIIKFDNGIK